jgi:hypothetical protein
LSDPRVLAQAVACGLMDAPQLVNNPYAPGRIQTRSLNGAMVAIDENRQPLREKDRIKAILADTVGV